MAYGKRVTWDAIRELAFGSISDTYANLGVALTKGARAIKITNATDVTVYVTDDITEDKLKLPTNSYELWDVTANKTLENKPQFLEVGKQFSVRHITGSAPSSGWVSIEVLTVESGS